MAKSHSSGLENVSNLRIDCWVVPSSAKSKTVPLGTRIRGQSAIDLSWDEVREPLVVDNVLMGGDGELTGTVEQPLVLFINPTHTSESALEYFGPVLVHSEPKNTHG